jgi:hypothetical protein
VAASGARDLRSAKLSGLQNGRYTVKLVFSSPDSAKHRFDVSVQDRVVKDLQPQMMLASSETFSDIRVANGTLLFTLKPHEGVTLLSGIEVIRTAD